MISIGQLIDAVVEIAPTFDINIEAIKAGYVIDMNKHGKNDFVITFTLFIKDQKIGLWINPDPHADENILSQPNEWYTDISKFIDKVETIIND